MPIRVRFSERQPLYAPPVSTILPAVPTPPLRRSCHARHAAVVTAGLAGPRGSAGLAPVRRRVHLQPTRPC